MSRRRSRSRRRSSGRSPFGGGGGGAFGGGCTAWEPDSRQRSAHRDRERDRERDRDRARDRDRDRERGTRGPAEAAPRGGSPTPNPWQFAGYGAYPGMPGAFPGWPQQMQQLAAGMAEKKKKKKKKKRTTSSSSSSSSSSESDWRQKVWAQWGQGLWPGMQGATVPGGQMWGWPAAAAAPGGPQHWPAAPTSAAPLSDAAAIVPRGGRDGHHGSGSRGDSGAREERERREELPDDVPIFLEPAIEEYVPVPKALLGKVIGKQAQTIIEIREKSGAFKVDARDQTTDPCMVKVAGTAEAVKKAKALIMEMVESTKNKHAGSDYVEIPRAKIGMVIGLKGSQVNEIQNQTGTKIDVDFESDPCKCYIKGQPPNVDRAKKVLLTIAMQIEDDNSEYIDLPKATSGALIGAQGSRVREFQEQSGARIDVDKTGPRCRVRITGNKEQIANAKQLILAEVEHSLPSLTKPPPPPAMLPAAPQPMVIPSHQPTTFPATLSESIARAKAAAEAVKNGLITGPPVAPSLAPLGQMAQPVPPPALVPPPPPAAVVPPAQVILPPGHRSIFGVPPAGINVPPPPVPAAPGAGAQPYRPW